MALDSTFALAWAQLSLVHSKVYCGTPTAAGAAAARAAAERALALAPKLPEGYFALAFYHWCVRHDVTRALEQSRRASQLAPKNALFLTVVAQNELALGYTEEGLAHLREAQLSTPARSRPRRGRCTRWLGFAATPRRCKRPTGGWRSPRPTSG